MKNLTKKAIIEATNTGSRYFLDLGSEFSTYLISYVNGTYILTTCDREDGQPTGRFEYSTLAALKADIKEIKEVVNANIYG